LVGIILDGRLTKLVWFVYKRAMWALTYAFIQYDPAWLARDRQKAARQKLQVASDARGKVKEQQALIESTIAGFQADATRLQKEANYLQSHNGETAEIRGRAMQLAEAIGAIKELQPGADQVKVLDAKLKEVLDALKATNDSIDYKIDVIVRKYKASNALGGIMGVLKSAFRGSEDVEGMRDLAMGFMSEETERQFGQIDAFLDDVDSFMKGRNLTDAIRADDGMKVLEDLNSRTLQLKVQPVDVELEPAVPLAYTKGNYWTKKD